MKMSQSGFHILPPSSAFLASMGVAGAGLGSTGVAEAGSTLETAFAGVGAVGPDCAGPLWAHIKAAASDSTQNIAILSNAFGIARCGPGRRGHGELDDFGRPAVA